MASVQYVVKPKTKKRKKKVAVKKTAIAEDLSLDQEQPLSEEEIKIPVVSLSEVLEHDNLEVSDADGIQEELLNKNETNEERPNSSEDLDHNIDHEENESTNENLNYERIDAINGKKEEAPVTGTNEVDADLHHNPIDKEISVDEEKEETTTLTDEANATSNNEELISIDVIKEETPTIEANADLNNEELISIDVIKEETPTIEANATSNNEELISVDVIKEETPAIEANTDLNNEELISVDVIKEETPAIEANADLNNEELINVDVVKEEMSLASQANADLYYHSHNEEMVERDIVMERSLTSQVNADLYYHSHNEEMIERDVIMEMPLTDQANADLYYYPLVNQVDYYNPLANYYPLANQAYYSHNEEMVERDVVMEMPPTNQTKANNLQQVSLPKKKDKSDPTYYLPSDSFKDSCRYRCCKKLCSCNCPTCFDCTTCCSCCIFKDWKIIDTPEIKNARFDGMITIAKAVINNIYHNPVIREIIVYLGLIFTLYSLVESSIGLVEGIQSDGRQLEKNVKLYCFWS